MLSRRFEIQDIVAQDSFGVTFRALDTRTGEPVALRRFFPFGADGGGLFDEERSDYAAAVARLVSLQHPGLRGVLTGGCDPVDGMPFVATEWIDGESVAAMLQRGTFTPAGAIAVLDRALDVSAALSEALGTWAVWVETAPELIIDDGRDPRRGLTFALAPMKWIGTEAPQRNLLPLAELAEDLLGWRGKRFAAQAGQGLGAWVKWLRANADALTLGQARESLAGLACGAGPVAGPPPARVNLPPPPEGLDMRHPVLSTLRPAHLKKSPAKEPWVLIVALAALVVAAGWWVVHHPVTRGTRRAVAAAPLNGTAPGARQLLAPSATAPPEEQRAALAASPPPAPGVADGAPPPRAAGDPPGGVFRSGDTERIMQEKDREVTVEGVLKNIRASDSGKTLYLEFVETTQQDEVRGCFVTKRLSEDMSVDALQGLVGKRIRISGVVRIMHHFKVKWPEVLLRDRQAIQEVP